MWLRADRSAFRHQQQMATWASTLSIQYTEDYRINLHPKVHITRNPHTVEEDFGIIQYPEVIYRKKGGRGRKQREKPKKSLYTLLKGDTGSLSSQNHVSITSLLFAGFLESACFCKSMNSAPLLANNRRKFITERSANLLTAKSA